MTSYISCSIRNKYAEWMLIMVSYVSRISRNNYSFNSISFFSMIPLLFFLQMPNYLPCNPDEQFHYPKAHWWIMILFCRLANIPQGSLSHYNNALTSIPISLCWHQSICVWGQIIAFGNYLRDFIFLLSKVKQQFFTIAK